MYLINLKRKKLMNNIIPKIKLLKKSKQFKGKKKPKKINTLKKYQFKKHLESKFQIFP